MLPRVFTRYVSLLSLFTVISCTFAAEQDREVFQVTFGTRPFLGQRSPTTDSGQFLVTADNGDVVVGGHGASTFTDTGDRTKPMIARINPSGHVIWRRIYDDLENHDVVAMLSTGGQQYVVFKHDQRDRSGGNPAPRQRISLRQVDDDGQLSRELGYIDDLYVADVLAYKNEGSAGFLVTALVTTGATFQRAFQRDISLFDLQISGVVNRPSFPEGIGGARLLQRNVDGSLVFLRLKTYFTEPMGFVRLSPEGALESLFSLDDNLISPMQVIATDDRLYMFETANWRNGFAPVTAYTHDGEVIWRKEIRGLSRFGQAIRQGDDLLVAGSYEGNPVIIKLTAEGNRVWTRRFRSAKKDAHIAGMTILEDGWLAVTGSTSPGGGAFVSTDSDAFLAVADPEGRGFDEFGACMADATEIEDLREELAHRAGLEIQREILMTGRQPRPVEELPPFDEPLPKSLDCGELSEHDLLTFLREAAAEAQELDLSKPSERVKIHVHLRPEGAIPEPGYREWGRREAGAVPSIEVTEDSARLAMRFIATEILPYTERMLAVTDELRAATGMWVGEARSHEAAGGLPPFKENTLVAERFLELFRALDPTDQSTVRTRIGNHPLVVGANTDVLHLWGDRWILVGQDRIDGVFTYLLDELPELEQRIEDRSQILRSDLNLHVRKSDPDLFHSDYLEVLEQIIATIGQLTDDDVAIIQSTGADVHVSNSWVSDIFLPGRHRMVYIEPVAAPHLLKFIVEEESQLQAQGPRRE